jgi:peptidyl-prolyl cis-trans isomerase C
VIRLVAKRHWLPRALLACGVLVAGCGREPETSGTGTTSGALGSGVVAQVGDVQLTETELQHLIPPELGEIVAGSEVRDVIDRWVRSELLYQQAQRDELDKDAEVASRLRDLERELLADKLLERELESRVQVTGDELQAYYRRHLGQYTQEVQLKQIVVNTPEEADEIIQMLRSGANFEQLARQRSIDPTGARGGDLGFLGKDALNPAFEPWVFDQPVGAIVGPIASTFGFHVVKVAAQRPASDPITFEAARDEIMHALLLEKQQAATAALLAELRAASRVQVASTYAGMSLEPEPETPERTPGSFVPSGAAARVPEPESSLPDTSGMNEE